MPQNSYFKMLHTLLDNLQIYPGLHCPRVSFEALKEAVEADFLDKNMKCTDDDVSYKQVDKTIQIYETLQARHTIMVVGPTGGGKTVCIDALQRSCLPAFNESVKKSNQCKSADISRFIRGDGSCHKRLD